MDYNQTIEFLYNSTPAFERVGAVAYKEGMENTLALDEHFGHPHHNFRTIHVAGTNGKGSTSHTLAAVLQQAGYVVGLYTSPHIVDFAERIMVDGQYIDQQYVIDFVHDNLSFIEELHPSMFELITAMAFRYFADMKVDIAVVEVGLGGRLDCTNVITPELTVITNISYDHTGILGETLQEIAAEKAGIMKRGVPCVIGEYLPETLPVFREQAEHLNAMLILAQDHVGEYFIPDFQLKGGYQERNAQTIVTACQVLSNLGILPPANTLSYMSIIKEAFAHVCELTKIRGRWETVSLNPLVVCDTGHNLSGWQYLASQIKSQKCACLRIVFGMVDDKDIDGVLSLLPDNATYYFCQADTKRAIPSDEIRQKAAAKGLKGISFANVADAFHSALEEASADDFVFVGGSSYVVSDMLRTLEKENKNDAVRK